MTEVMQNDKKNLLKTWINQWADSCKHIFNSTAKIIVQQDDASAYMRQ